MDTSANADKSQPYAYEGPPTLKGPIETALRRVIDPELALTIVDVGLVYGVTVSAGVVRVTMTMTSAACPVTDVILADVETELDAVVPPDLHIDIELVWDPPWTAERLSPRAKVFMGW